MRDTAVMIFSYGGTVLDVSLSSIVKYLSDYDIYLLDSVEPEHWSIKGKKWQPHLKQNITDCLDKYGKNVKRIELNDGDISDMGGADMFKKFAISHPQYDYIFKIDDDMFMTDYGVIEGLKEGLAQDNVLVSTTVSPFSRVMPEVIQEKTDIRFTPSLLDRGMNENVKRYLSLLYELWGKTFPIDKLLPKLRNNPDKFAYPTFSKSKHWSCGNYLIKRDEYIKIFDGGNSDEKMLNKLHRNGRRICVCTHHLIYHHGYWWSKEWTDKNIMPTIRQHNFWR